MEVKRRAERDNEREREGKRTENTPQKINLPRSLYLPKSNTPLNARIFHDNFGNELRNDHCESLSEIFLQELLFPHTNAARNRRNLSVKIFGGNLDDLIGWNSYDTLKSQIVDETMIRKDSPAAKLGDTLVAFIDTMQQNESNTNSTNDNMKLKDEKEQRIQTATTATRRKSPSVLFLIECLESYTPLIDCVIPIVIDYVGLLCTFLEENLLPYHAIENLTHFLIDEGDRYSHLLDVNHMSKILKEAESTPLIFSHRRLSYSFLQSRNIDPITHKIGLYPPLTDEEKETVAGASIFDRFCGDFDYRLIDSESELLFDFALTAKLFVTYTIWDLLHMREKIPTIGNGGDKNDGENSSSSDWSQSLHGWMEEFVRAHIWPDFDPSLVEQHQQQDHLDRNVDQNNLSSHSSASQHAHNSFVSYGCSRHQAFYGISGGFNLSNKQVWIFNEKLHQFVCFELEHIQSY